MKQLSLKTLVIITIIYTIPMDYMHAQNHYSMLDGNPEWVYHMTPHKNASHWVPSYAWAFSLYGSEMFVRIYVRNDTIVDNHEYKFLYIAAYDSNGKLIDGNKYNLLDRNNPSHFQYMREADGKVFSSYYDVPGVRFTKKNLENINQYNQHESIMFDDDIHLGDTVYENRNSEYSLIPHPYMAKCIISARIVGDTIIQVADGSRRRMLTYGCKNYYQELQYMIDGIGFINPDLFPIYSYFEIYDGYQGITSYNHYINLLMFRQHDKVVYIAPRCKEDASYEEKAKSFATMPFYPDITPENVADGTYTFPASANGFAENKPVNKQSVYNLQGQRTDGLERGINIIGGKKIMVR